jgi:hypothetical protein
MLHLALKQIALHHRRKEDPDANLADDDWLEAHPECRPVVVIDNFLHKNEESSVVYDKMSEWVCQSSHMLLDYLSSMDFSLKYGEARAISSQHDSLELKLAYLSINH